MPKPPTKNELENQLAEAHRRLADTQRQLAAERAVNDAAKRSIVRGRDKTGKSCPCVAIPLSHDDVAVIREIDGTGSISCQFDSYNLGRNDCVCIVDDCFPQYPSILVRYYYDQQDGTYIEAAWGLVPLTDAETKVIGELATTRVQRAAPAMLNALKLFRDSGAPFSEPLERAMLDALNEAGE